jgi:tetraacyldisaccharide 4'-kinase
VRRLALPARGRVLAIGGATLGGSGKTPLAIACAGEIAAAGARVAIVGHAYRAKPRRARVVAVDDPLAEVGDEALVAARALAPKGISVVVAPRRSAALAYAAGIADVLVLDGVPQTAPARASLALLAVDAAMPWGQARAVPPRGDLRAPRRALIEACDAVVAVGDAGDSGAVVDELPSDPERARWNATTVSSGARVRDVRLSWEDLAPMRVGLLCALARPERIVRSLERRGVSPRVVVRGGDHGPLGAAVFARAVRARVELGIEMWLATSKCALHFTPGAAEVGNRLQAPIAEIEHALVLSSGLKSRLRALGLP